MNLAKNLKVESVSRLQPDAARHMNPTNTVGEAVTLMRQEKQGCLLICENDRLVGIFTERDLMRRIVAQGKPMSVRLGDVMTADPEVVDRKESISAAIHRMESGGYRHLPVVDEKGKPVGVLSVKQIVHYIVEHFADKIYNLPPKSDVAQTEREGA